MICVYTQMFIFSKKKLWRGTCTEPTGHESQTFQWGGAACCWHRPIQGCLEIARNMGNRGADAPMGTSGPIRLRQLVHTSTASIRTSGGHPLWELCTSQHSKRCFLDQAIYILSSATLHVLATLVIRRGSASMKNVLWWAG